MLRSKVPSFLLVFSFGYLSLALPSVIASSEVAKSEASSGVLCKEAIEGYRLHFAGLDSSKSIGSRGFIATEPPLSGESRIGAGQAGVNYLSLRVIVMPSIEAAKADDLRRKTDEKTKDMYEAIRVVYAISPIDVHTIDNKDQTAVVAAFRKVIASGLIMLDGDKVVRYEPSQYEKILDPQKIQLRVLGQGDYGFLQMGWLTTPFPGVIEYQDTIGSEKYEGIRRFARNRFKEGYQLRFNSDIDAVLNLLKRQLRKDIMIKDKDRLVFTLGGSRYAADPNLVATMRNLYQEGYLYTVEWWSPDGHLVGGEIGYQFGGGLFKSDSTFYDVQRFLPHKIISENPLVIEILNNVKTSFDPMMFAMSAGVAFQDRLHELGVDLVDCGSMVTNYTREMKGKPMPRCDYLNWVAQLQAMSALDLKQDWTWSEELKARELKISDLAALISEKQRMINRWKDSKKNFDAALIQRTESEIAELKNRIATASPDAQKIKDELKTASADRKPALIAELRTITERITALQKEIRQLEKSLPSKAQLLTDAEAQAEMKAIEELSEEREELLKQLGGK